MPIQHRANKRERGRIKDMSIDEAIRSINYGLKMETTDAPLVRQMTIVRTDALQVALDALRTQQEREKNEPLTLDELRKMDGEPVWCVDGFGCERWGLVNTENVLLEVISSDSEALEGAFYNMTGDGKMGLHPWGWLAYRRKPKEETK